MHVKRLALMSGAYFAPQNVRYYQDDLKILACPFSLPFYTFCYGVSCDFTHESRYRHAAIKPLCFWILLFKGHFSEDFFMVSRFILY